MDVKHTTDGADQDAAPADPSPPTNTIRCNYKRVVTREERYLRYVVDGRNMPHTTDADNVGSWVSMTYSGLKLLT
jgi:hypothetical protein